MLNPARPVGDEEGAIVDGRYVLKRVAAEDGAARVYVAQHVHTRRDVVLKLPRNHDASTRERMRREIEALAKVRAPGISEILDAGETNGEPYVVLELLVGRSLAGLLAARGRLGVPETVKVGVQVARALAHCHSRGIVHRDVKPSNVFVTHDVARQLWLLDFGIAKLAGSDAARPKITREDAILGTPEYMAPEALLAEGELDARSDLYSLGVSLYECLTGAVPFEGHYVDVLLKVSTTAPRPLEELCTDVPPALSGVIARSLGRLPEDRFADARQMADALAGALGGAFDDVDLLGHRPPPASPAAPARSAATTADAPRPKSSADGVSRRRFPRAAYSSLSRVSRGDGSFVDGRIEELSEGGTQFVGDQAIESGQTVSIRFALPSTGRIAKVQAASRWNRTVRGTNATGFEFMDLSADARAEIRTYVSFMGGALGSASD